MCTVIDIWKCRLENFLWSTLELEVVLQTLDSHVHVRRLVLEERRNGQVPCLLPCIQVPVKQLLSLLGDICKWRHMHSRMGG